MQIELIVNSKLVKWDVEPDELLIDALRKNGNLSVKRGCDTTCCGLCSVWIDGKPTLSCCTLAARAHGKSVTTLEGVQDEAKVFAQILVDDGAEQCGYCSPGFVMTVLALKNEIQNPTEEDIKHYLTGNLCRCTGYMGQLRAVKKYLGVE